MPRKSHTEVPMGFEKATRRLAIADLQPLKIVSAVKKSPKYAQIVASIGEIGIVEPPVVTPDPKDKGYAKSLVAATPQDQLAEGYKPKRVRGLTSAQVALMERETANLDREFRIAEQSYGTDHLDLVIASGYIGKLLGNAKVVRYLGMQQKEILLEFQKLVELEAAAA